MDTACSSALVAVGLACQSLRCDKMQTALAAGVSLHPHAVSWLWPGPPLALDALCKTFDSSADGYGRGEGCMVAVLAAAPHRQGIMLGGTAINQDGRSASFMAPSGLSQQQVIATAMQSTKIQNHIFETHGTGTRLGDPIEVQALKQALRGRRITLVLGALKTRLGHTEYAAGAAGMLKAVLTLDRLCVHPNLHLRRLNPALDMQDVEPVLPAQTSPMGSLAASAGVSSFGITGTNSHALLTAAVPTYQAVLMSGENIRFKHVSFEWFAAPPVVTQRLLGSSTTAQQATNWEHRWPHAICNFLAHHRVGDSPLAPGTLFLQLVRTAISSEQTGAGPVQMADIKFTSMLFLDIQAALPIVRVSVQGTQIGLVESKSHAMPEWTIHVRMVAAPLDQIHRSLLRLPATRSISTGCQFYASIGNSYQGNFRSVEAVWLTHSDKDEILIVTKVTLDTSWALHHQVSGRVSHH